MIYSQVHIQSFNCVVTVNINSDGTAKANLIKLKNTF